jgi:hypothetical protein
MIAYLVYIGGGSSGEFRRIKRIRTFLWSTTLVAHAKRGPLIV